MASASRPKLKKQEIAGLPASPGVAIGPLYIVRSQEPAVQRRTLTAEQAQKEVVHFRKCIQLAKRELVSARKEMNKIVGEYESQIFDAHLMILSDPEIVENVEKDILEELRNAEFSFSQRMNSIIRRFDNLKDPFFRERAADLRELSTRVLGILQSKNPQKFFQELDSPVIILADEFSTFALSQMNKKNTLGFITQMGGATSHAAILARSLEIPAVVGVSLAALQVEDGDIAIMDGESGIVILNPTAKEIKQYEQKQLDQASRERRLFSARTLDSRTLDGKYIELSANIELPVEVDKVLEYGADSIGLYRSEYLYLTRDSLPTQEEQFQAYRFIGERMKPRTVVIRTFDSGGDKMVPGIQAGSEENPFMGFRSIRVCLEEKELFATQLRAIILAAQATKNIRLMFPMVSGLGELLEAKAILNKVREELAEQGHGPLSAVKVGCMIEVPAAALQAEALAKEVDFFSIGTNDLIQFTLAVDRGNQRIAKLFDPCHPSVLKIISMIIAAAKKEKIPISVCGEMAGVPKYAALLIGMGVDELSMSPSSVLPMKKFVRAVNSNQLVDLWKSVQLCEESKDIHALLEKIISPIVSGLDGE